jgi:hypothetical protein
MAKTIQEIQEEMIAAKEGYQELSGLSGSASAIWRLLFFIIATAVWTLERLFDLHKVEVSGIIATLKPHTARWYAAKAKLFQYGDNLIPDSDLYDNTGKTDEEIQTSRIVAYSAVVEVEKQLLIKTAKITDDLQPLSTDELTAFAEYMSRIKDAGVQVTAISEPADNLRLSLDIYYNPLVLNSEGQRLDGAGMTPIADAVRNYLKNLPFNGEFVLAYLIDALQHVEGVVIPHIVSAMYQYGDLDYGMISVKYQPYAGYLRVTDENMTVNYIPQSEIN